MKKVLLSMAFLSLCSTGYSVDVINNVETPLERETRVQTEIRAEKMADPMETSTERDNTDSMEKTIKVDVTRDVDGTVIQDDTESF